MRDAVVEAARESRQRIIDAVRDVAEQEFFEGGTPSLSPYHRRRITGGWDGGSGSD